MANSFASPGTPSWVSDASNDGVVPRRLFKSDDAYFQYLLRKEKTVEACEPQLHDAFIEFVGHAGSRQSSVAVTNMSDVETLPSDWQAISPRLITSKADEIGAEFRQYQADQARQRQQHQLQQQQKHQSQRQFAAESGGYTGSSGLGAFPPTATHNAQTPPRSQSGHQSQQQFAAATSGGRMGSSVPGAFPLAGSPAYDPAARDARQSMPTTPTPAAGRSRRSMPQLPAQTAADHSRRAEMLAEIRCETADWELTSLALLEARKACSDLEEKFGRLSMRLIKLTTEIGELPPGDQLHGGGGVEGIWSQSNLGAEASGPGLGQTVSTPEETEGKKRTRGRRGGKKHANREQGDLLG